MLKRNLLLALILVLIAGGLIRRNQQRLNRNSMAPAWAQPTR